MKELNDKNGNRLDVYWKNKIDTLIKEIVKLMNEFYNDKFREIKVINEEIVKKLNSSKR